MVQDSRCGPAYGRFLCDAASVFRAITKKSGPFHYDMISGRPALKNVPVVPRTACTNDDNIVYAYSQIPHISTDLHDI